MAEDGITESEGDIGGGDAKEEEERGEEGGGEEGEGEDRDTRPTERYHHRRQPPPRSRATIARDRH